MKRISDQGVSEIIGVVLLVSMVAILVMVVATALISQPRPEKVPEVNLAFSVNGTGQNDIAPYNITFTYLGGDELGEGEYFIVVNNEPVLKNGPIWSASNPTRTIYYVSEKPLNIQVYYQGSSGPVLLAKTYIT